MIKIVPKHGYLLNPSGLWSDSKEGAIAEIFTENDMWFFVSQEECFGPYANEFICRNHCLATAVPEEKPIEVDWEGIAEDMVDEMLNEPVDPIPAGYPAPPEIAYGEVQAVQDAWGDVLHKPVVPKNKPAKSNRPSLVDILEQYATR